MLCAKLGKIDSNVVFHWINSLKEPIDDRGTLLKPPDCSIMLSRSSHGCRKHVLPRLKQMFLVNRPQILDKCLSSIASEPHMSVPSSKSENQNKSQSAVEDDNVAQYVTEENPTLKTLGVVPGKGPPPEPPVDCCMSGCVTCVWIAYAESLKEYYADGGKAAIDALEQIENPSLKMFVKLEMGLL